MFLSEWTHQQKLQKNFNVKILSKIRNKLKWSFWFNNTIIKYECVGVCTTERIPRMDLKSWHFQTNFVTLKLLFGRLSNIYIYSISVLFGFPQLLRSVCAVYSQNKIVHKEALCSIAASVTNTVVVVFIVVEGCYCYLFCCCRYIAHKIHTSKQREKDLQFNLLFGTKFQFDF